MEIPGTRSSTSPRCSMPPTLGRCARPVARHTPSEARPTTRQLRRRPCQNPRASRRPGRGSRSRERAKPALPPDLAASTPRQRRSRVAAGRSAKGRRRTRRSTSRTRRRGNGRPASLRASRRDEVQRLRRTGLAGRRDPQPLIVVGEDRVPDLGDPQPLEDSARRRRDAHEVDSARVIPFVEPEVAAAVDPCRRRVAPCQRRERHHDGTERVPRGVRDDVGDAHDRGLVPPVLARSSCRSRTPAAPVDLQVPDRRNCQRARRPTRAKTGRPKPNSRCP